MVLVLTTGELWWMIWSKFTKYLTVTAKCSVAYKLDPSMTHDDELACIYSDIRRWQYAYPGVDQKDDIYILL